MNTKGKSGGGQPSGKTQDIAPIMAALESAVVQIDNLDAPGLLKIRGLFLQLFDTALVDRKVERQGLQVTLDKKTRGALAKKLPSDLPDRLRALKNLKQGHGDDALLSGLIDEAEAELAEVKAAARRAAAQKQARQQENKAKDTIADVTTAKNRQTSDEMPKPPPRPKPKGKANSAASAEPIEGESNEVSSEAALLKAEEGKMAPGIFEDLLVSRTAGMLGCFAIEPDAISPACKDEPLPFLFAPGFSAAFEAYLRDHILPQVIDHRFVDTRILAAVRRHDDVSITTQLEKLIDEEPKAKEAIHHVWEATWQAETDAINNKAKTTDPQTLKDKIKKKRQAWRDFGKAASHGDGAQASAPETDDLKLFAALLDWPKEAKLNEQIKSVYDSISQEHAGESSEGWVARHLGDMGLKQADHMGDLISTWAYFVHGDALTEERDSGGTILKSLISSQGRSMNERRQRLRYLLRFSKAAQDITKNWT